MRTCIDDYISDFPPPIRKLLQAVRKTIRAAAPEAEERLSYRMPTFYLRGNLVHFAAFKNHIGFFPTASGVAAFEKELAGYAHSKGAIRFPLDQPIPHALVRRITTYRVRENLARQRARGD